MILVGIVVSGLTAVNPLSNLRQPPMIGLSPETHTPPVVPNLPRAEESRSAPGHGNAPLRQLVIDADHEKACGPQKIIRVPIRHEGLHQFRVDEARAGIAAALDIRQRGIAVAVMDSSNADVPRAKASMVLRKACTSSLRLP